MIVVGGSVIFERAYLGNRRLCAFLHLEVTTSEFDLSSQPNHENKRKKQKKTKKKQTRQFNIVYSIAVFPAVRLFRVYTTQHGGKTESRNSWNFTTPYL